MHNYPLYASIILLILDAALYRMIPMICRTRLSLDKILLIVWTTTLAAIFPGIITMLAWQTTIRGIIGFLVIIAPIYVLMRIFVRITELRLPKAKA